MALGEARTAWQRTANRYLVQEDAKRAPKLACCSTTAKPDDVEPTNAPDKEYIPNITLPPLDQNSSDFNLSPESQWWLHLQPHCLYQKGLINEHLNFQEMNIETLSTHEDCRVDEKEPSSLSSLKSRYGLEHQGAIDFDELTITDFEDSKLSEKSSELYLDSTSSWIGAEKHVPWWRTADTEELAILVSQRSLDVIENCDLPQPQSARVRKDVYTNVCDFGRGGINKSPLDQKPKTGSYGSLSIPTQYSLKAENASQKQWAPVKIRPPSNAKRSTSPTAKGAPQRHTIEDDLSKAQLLEALRHSQTRAREAEKAAKLADVEKEDLVKLVFRQASQLFAYKQWFHLLQLENIYIQMKNNYSEPLSTVLPRMPQRTRKMRETGWQKCTLGKRVRKPRYRYNASKYALVFALGLGLVGAGLLLGWTVGLMLPAL